MGRQLDNLAPTAMRISYAAVKREHLQDLANPDYVAMQAEVCQEFDTACETRLRWDGTVPTLRL